MRTETRFKFMRITSSVEYLYCQQKADPNLSSHLQVIKGN